MRARGTSEWLLLPGALALMAGPAVWLAESWAHNPSGALVALAWGGLLLAAVSSGPADGDRRGAALALALGVCVRIFARWAQIDSLGALVLVLDAYALCRLLGVHRRPLALHPGWMAALFAASLPVEAILSRLVGWPLRLATAEATAALIGGARVGTKVAAGDLWVGVEEVCNGVQGLTLLSVAAIVLLATRRGNPAALLLAVAGAFVANVLRLCLLFGGLDRGLPVLAEPMHSAIGVIGLIAGALPLLLLARAWPARSPAPPAPGGKAMRPAASLLLSGLAIGAALAPMPSMGRVAPPQVGLPGAMGAWMGAPLPVSAAEERFFLRAGAAIEKRRYVAPGEASRTVLLIRTSAPLRMHDPTLCLAGDGWQMERIGLRGETVLWRGTAPDGARYLVTVDFRSVGGDAADSVSEMLWMWSRRPDQGWIVIEQITPWDVCEDGNCEHFDALLRGALEV